MDSRSDTSRQGQIIAYQSPTIKRYESDEFGVSEFAYPKSRLIRRMRRCERRVLPLLDEWVAVDVVLTSHELIIFDILDEMHDSDVSNGGKGLHLSDVARGRNIVSQFNLDDVDFVDIEHRPAILGDIDDEDIEGNYKMNLMESWQGGRWAHADYDTDGINKRWEGVDEDRLKIHFKYNTLYLRFMVDLKEMEQKRKALMGDSDLMHHVGTQTKLWCRTIARLRGATNLKQALPHFGNNGTDEMEDFIEMCERGQEGTNPNHKRTTKSLSNLNHKRSGSLGNLSNINNASKMRKGIHRRMISMGGQALE